jgi:hypothetical protein
MNLKKFIAGSLQSVFLWIATSIIAIALVEVQPLVGMVFALIGGIALGILSFRGARA